MISNISDIKNWHDIGLNEAAKHYDEESFVALIKSDEWWKIPTEEDVDRGFEIAKSTPHSQLIHFRLTDVCRAYLKLNTEKGCKKAFKVVKFKSPNYEPGSALLEPIVKMCLKLKTVGTIILARKIFDRYPNSMKYSFEEKRSLEFLEEQIKETHEDSKKLEKPKLKKQKANDCSINSKTIDLVIPALTSNSIKVKAKSAEIFENVQQVFNNIQSRDIEHLKQILGNLSVEEKTKLLSSKMEFNTTWARGKEEMTPLQYCCYINNFDAFKVLINSGANVHDFTSTSDSTQRSSLHFAIDSNASEIALFLIFQGVQDRLASCDTLYGLKAYGLPNEFGGSFTCMSALHMAIIKNMYIVVEKLLQSGNVNIMEKSSGINSVLHLAAKNKNIEIYNLLLAHGGHKLTEVKNHLNMTPAEYFSKETMVL